MTPANGPQIRKALHTLPDGELFTLPELISFIAKYYYKLLFIPAAYVEEACIRMSRNRFSYFNAILINGIAYYWLDKIAFEEMRKHEAEKAKAQAACRMVRVYSNYSA